jgi:hypothetical protein
VSTAARVDHLVVAAHSLEAGAAWCEAVLGVTPSTGGKHPLMGTHNRLLSIASPAHPLAYLEIIAIDPDAPSPGRPRWFDLDEPAMHRALLEQPRLIHFAAHMEHADEGVAALAQLGLDRGPLIAAERGVLRWQISVRPDGRRLFAGALPTLIQWGDAHPCDTLPSAGVTLETLSVTHPEAQRLAAAFHAIGLQGVNVAAGDPNLIATLQTPRGLVRLESRGA